jgi:2-desacetyl-2-hydroxyethyl bacteriochlorophyllide A dehydrogenase
MGGNAEYLIIPELLLPMVHPVSDKVSFEELATVEPLATSLHAVNLAKPQPGENHVILGAGIIGLGVLQVLKTMSDIKTIVVDVSEKRLEMARQLGADIIINAGEEDALSKIIDLFGSEQMSFMPTLTGKADTAYDCAGLSMEFTGIPILKQAVTMVKVDGKVVVVAVFEKFPEVDFNLMVRKGITIYGSWGWNIEEFKQSLDLIADGKVDRKPLITHQFPLEKAVEAYETQLNAKEAIKVMIIP